MHYSIIGNYPPSEWRSICLPVLLGASRGEGSKTRHEEVKTGEGNHVDRQLPKVSVQLAGEPQAGGHTRHGQGNKMVEISVGGCRQFQGSKADVVQGLVVDAVCLVCVLNQLVHGEGGVVGLDHGVGHLGGGHDGVGVHDSVGVLFSEKQRGSSVLFLKCTAVTLLYQLI